MKDDRARAAPRHRGMLCRIERLEYDFTLRRAILHFPADNRPDMAGAVAAVEKIDGRVCEILTVADGLPDTSYLLIDGKWRAIPAPAFAWRPNPAFVRRALWERSC